MAATDIINTLFAGVVTTMEALTPATDTGAPSQFHELDYALLEESTEDLGFAVYLPSGEVDQQRQVTSEAGGTGDYMIRFAIEVKFINEGRSLRSFDTLVARNRRRIMDVVQSEVRALSGSFGECLYEGGPIQRDSTEPGIVYSVQTFSVEYKDEVVT